MPTNTTFDQELFVRGLGFSKGFGGTGGDSFVAGAGAQGSSAALRAIFDGRYRILNERRFAVGGKIVSQMIAEQIPGLIASGARWAIADGGINDIAQGVSETDLRANLISMWGLLRAANIAPFDLGMPPSNTGNVIGGVDERILYANHEFWRQQYCWRNGISHIHYWPLIAQANGNFAAGMNVDTRHPSVAAEDLMAGELVRVLDDPARLAPFRELLDRAAGSGNVFPNAVSFGGVGSALPSGYATTGAAGPTFSVVAGDAGTFGNWLSADFAGAVGSQAGFKGTQRTLAQLGWSVGDRIAFGCELRFTSATVSPRVSLQGGDVTFAAPLAVQDEVGSVNPMTSRDVYWEGVITGGTNFNVGVTGIATGAGSMQIRRPVLYNLTKNGLA